MRPSKAKIVKLASTDSMLQDSLRRGAVSREMYSVDRYNLAIRKAHLYVEYGIPMVLLPVGDRLDKLPVSDLRDDVLFDTYEKALEALKKEIKTQIEHSNKELKRLSAVYQNLYMPYEILNNIVNCLDSKENE